MTLQRRALQREAVTCSLLAVRQSSGRGSDRPGLESNPVPRRHPLKKA